MTAAIETNAKSVTGGAAACSVVATAARRVQRGPRRGKKQIWIGAFLVFWFNISRIFFGAEHSPLPRWFFSTAILCRNWAALTAAAASALVSAAASLCSELKMSPSSSTTRLGDWVGCSKRQSSGLNRSGGSGSEAAIQGIHRDSPTSADAPASMKLFLPRSCSRSTTSLCARFSNLCSASDKLVTGPQRLPGKRCAGFWSNCSSNCTTNDKHRKALPCGTVFRGVSFPTAHAILLGGAAGPTHKTTAAFSVPVRVFFAEAPATSPNKELHAVFLFRSSAPPAPAATCFLSPVLAAAPTTDAAAAAAAATSIIHPLRFVCCFAATKKATALLPHLALHSLRAGFGPPCKGFSCWRHCGACSFVDRTTTAALVSRLVAGAHRGVCAIRTAKTCRRAEKAVPVAAATASEVEETAAVTTGTKGTEGQAGAAATATSAFKKKGPAAEAVASAASGSSDVSSIASAKIEKATAAASAAQHRRKKRCRSTRAVASSSPNSFSTAPLCNGPAGFSKVHPLRAADSSAAALADGGFAAAATAAPISRQWGAALSFETLVGVEVHMQLLTASKLFCSCPSQVALTHAAAQLSLPLFQKVHALLAGHHSSLFSSSAALRQPSPTLAYSRNSAAGAGAAETACSASGLAAVTACYSGASMHAAAAIGAVEKIAEGAGTAATQLLEKNLLPNTFVCPTCLGDPGSLPRVNAAAVAAAVKAALLLQCALIPEVLEFDRKGYFYPDLPKNFQTSQVSSPIGRNGCVALPTTGKAVRIRSIHLEEDTAKMMHAHSCEEGDFFYRETLNNSRSTSSNKREEKTAAEAAESHISLIDFNRASLPLLEIVTEPDLSSGEEVVEFLRELSLLFRFAGLSTCAMPDGAMRCDLNISLRNRQTQQDYPRTEVKNVGTLRGAKRVVQYETERQTHRLLKHLQYAQNKGKNFCQTIEKQEPLEHAVEKYSQVQTAPFLSQSLKTSTTIKNDEEEASPLVAETRMWSDKLRRTLRMRRKYRSDEYFIVRENAIPPIQLFNKQQLHCIREKLPETPAERRLRIQRDYLLDKETASNLTANPQLFEFFLATVRNGGPAAAAARWLLNEVAGLTKNTSKQKRSSGLNSSRTSEIDDADDEENTFLPPGPRTPRTAQTPAAFAEMLRMIQDGRLTRMRAKKLLPDLLAGRCNFSILTAATGDAPAIDTFPHNALVLQQRQQQGLLKAQRETTSTEAQIATKAAAEACALRLIMQHVDSLMKFR